MTAAVAVILATGPALAGQGEEHLYDAQGRYQGRTTGGSVPGQKK